MFANIKKRIEELRESIIKHDKLYESNKPIITDTEYDQLYDELVRLERQFPELVTENSPTQRIVTTVAENLKKVTHSTPMLSQDKIHTAEDIEKFAAKLV